MLRIGCIVLTAWTVLNLIPSAAIVVNTIFRDGHTPALYLLLTEEEVGDLEPDVLATLDSIAVFANGLNLAFCLVSLFTIWKGLYCRRVWAFWGLLAGFSLALLAGVGADYEVHTAAPMVNVISGGILGLGFAISAFGLFLPPETPRTLATPGAGHDADGDAAEMRTGR